MGVRWSRMSWSERNELRAGGGASHSERLPMGCVARRSVIYTVVAAECGIPPRPRRRSRLILTGTEHEEISRQLACAQSLRAISRILGRAPSTLSREVARNGGRSIYRATVADGHAWHRTRRPQRCRLSTRPTLRRIVARKLATRRSEHSACHSCNSSRGSDRPRITSYAFEQQCQAIGFKLTGLSLEAVFRQPGTVLAGAFSCTGGLHFPAYIRHGSDARHREKPSAARSARVDCARGRG
jgi:hypothetical protein